jgi:hypothetical protein
LDEAADGGWRVRGSARSWLLVAAVAVLGGIGLSCSPGVPLYDGVGFPDEPYRFVSPPVGAAATKPPTTGARQVRMTDGTSEATELATGEYGPQCHVLLGPGALRGTAAAVSLRLVPRAPLNPPPQGTAEGNVYAVEAVVAQGHRVSGDAGEVGVISLRALSAAQPAPVIEYRSGDAAAWSQLVTLRVGQDVYEAPFQGLGEYLLVRTSPASVPATVGRGGGGPVWLFAGGAAAGGLFLLVVAAVTRARGRVQDPQPS